MAPLNAVPAHLGFHLILVLIRPIDAITVANPFGRFSIREFPKLFKLILDDRARDFVIRVVAPTDGALVAPIVSVRLVR